MRPPPWLDLAGLHPTPLAAVDSQRRSRRGCPDHGRGTVRSGPDSGAWRAATRSFDCREAAWTKGFVARRVLRRHCWRTPGLGERQRCPAPIHALRCHPALSSTGSRSTPIGRHRRPPGGGLRALPDVWRAFGPGSQRPPPPAARLAVARARCRACRPRPPLPLHGQRLPSADVHRAAAARGRRWLGAPHRPARRPRPGPRRRSRRPPRLGLGAEAHAAGPQGRRAPDHPVLVATGGRSDTRDRHRRMGLAPPAALRDSHLQRGAPAGRRPPAGPRARHGGGLALRPSPCPRGRARSRRRLCRRRGSGAAGGAGRGPVALDGERQRRLARGGSQRARADPPRPRSRRRRSRPAERRRAPPVRGLPAAARGERRHPTHGKWRHGDQGDRPPHRPQPQAGPRGAARHRGRGVPQPGKRPRALAGRARGRLVRWLPQRRRALAAAARQGLRRQLRTVGERANRRRPGPSPAHCWSGATV